MTTHVDIKLYLKILSQFVTASRKAKMEELTKARCHSVAVLLENVTDMGNENAVARTMDALGFHYLHRLSHRTSQATSSVIRKKPPTRTDAGSKKWLTMNSWNTIAECMHHIRTNGFKIASACPHTGTSIYDIDVNQKLVFAFGNESTGVSDKLKEISDIMFSLPMCGFVESYNVSVAAGITLFHVYTELMNQQKEIREQISM